MLSPPVILRYDDAMQVMIDLPDELYRELETEARACHTSLEALMIEKASLPAPSSRHTQAPRSAVEVNGRQTLIEMGINLNDLSFMPDDELARLTDALAVDPESAVKKFGLRTLHDRP